MSDIDEKTVRAEVRAWLEANWDPEYRPARVAQQAGGYRLGHAGLAEGVVRPGLCRPASRRVVDEEFQRIGAVGVARMGIRMLAAATLLAHGSEMHKEKFLRRILTGEDTWCQLFSEPGSGSDLAGATTRAELQGQHVDRQRPEGVDHQRAQGAIRPAARAHRLGRAEARGPVAISCST